MAGAFWDATSGVLKECVGGSGAVGRTSVAIGGGEATIGGDGGGDWMAIGDDWVAIGGRAVEMGGEGGVTRLISGGLGSCWTPARTRSSRRSAKARSIDRSREDAIVIFLIHSFAALSISRQLNYLGGTSDSTARSPCRRL